MSLTGAMSLVVNVAPPSVETAKATEAVLPSAVFRVGSLGAAPIHSLSLNTAVPWLAGVWTTKWVDQLLPPSVERLTATEFAKSVRSKAILAYQNVPFGPATTAGSPADSYGPGAAVSAPARPAKNPAGQGGPPPARPEKPPEGAKRVSPGVMRRG